MYLNKRKGEYRQIPTNRTLQRLFFKCNFTQQVLISEANQRTFGLFLTNLDYTWEVIGERGHQILNPWSEKRPKMLLKQHSFPRITENVISIIISPKSSPKRSLHFLWTTKGKVNFTSMSHTLRY